MGIVKVTKSLRKLKKSIDLSKGLFLYGVEINDRDKSALVIYPTNDLWLFDKQMRAVKAISDNQRLNLIQLSDEAHLPDEIDDIYSFDYPDDFVEYNSLFLHSACILFPDDYSWFCLVDETFDAGVGLLIAKDDTLREFFKHYDNSTDLENLRKELKRINPQKCNSLIEGLKQIITKW